MPKIVSVHHHTCMRSLRARQLNHGASIKHIRARRTFGTQSPLCERIEVERTEVKAPPPPLETSNGGNTTKEPEQGAMSRRLQAATEDALTEGGRAGRKAVEEAGFSDELKARLLDRIADANYKEKYSASFTEASLSSSVGRGSRDIATSQAWTGTESQGDAVLRMLNDAHKPLKASLRGRPGPRMGVDVDLRLQPKPKLNSGQRLAIAKERRDAYNLSQDPTISEKEREELRQTLRERFGVASKAGGAMPTSFRGLEGLANERIEDAIARGQFRDISRGQGALDLSRQGNPFIDTTEYILNNMIKRQEIVPPWIEKQQEVVSMINNFRSRIRHEWKRHVARTIASRGGSLEEQVRWAELYAAAERKHNPRKRDLEESAVPTGLAGHPVLQQMKQEVVAATSEPDFSGPEAMESVEPTPPPRPIVTEIGTSAELSGEVVTNIGEATAEPTISPSTPLPPPFRDSQWLAHERNYMELVIAQLNSLTRSYNLMAPELAKKPYFSLERELKAMFADVAPELASEIRARARRPAKTQLNADAVGKGAGLLEVLRGEGAHVKKVYDEDKPKYGFKELLQDWFGKKPDRRPRM